MVDPNMRGMKYGIIVGQMLNKAKLENPDNPRVYFCDPLKCLGTHYGDEPKI